MTRGGPWALSRRLSIGLLAAAGFVMTGCDVRPLYGASASGPAESVAASLATVHVAPIADQPGQTLRGILVQALSPNGRPADPVYTLTVSLRESRQDLGISRDDTATRGNLIVTARSFLTENATDRVVWGDNRRIIASFGILDEQFATIISERSAREGALQQIAQEIRTSMALLFQRGIPEPEEALGTGDDASRSEAAIR